MNKKIIAVCLLACLATGLFMPMLDILPVVHASTGKFGYTTKGASTTNSGSPINCNYTLPVSAYILSFTVYVNDPSPSSTEWVEVGLYNATSGSSPLIEYNKTATNKFSTGWVTFTFPSIEWFKAGVYGLAVKQITSSNSTGPTTTIYYDTGSTNQASYISGDTIGLTTNLPNPWAPRTANFAREYSEYCTYTTSLTATPPDYSGITYSSTCIGSNCSFGITVSDAIGLSKYIFSYDSGAGVLVNSTAVAFISDPQTLLVYRVLTTTVGATVRFRWFFNDTSGLWNSTSIQSFKTGVIAFEDTFSTGDLSRWTNIFIVGPGTNTVQTNVTYPGYSYDYQSYAPINSEAWLEEINAAWASLSQVFLSTWVKFPELNIPNGYWRNVLYGVDHGENQITTQVYNNSGVLEWQLCYNNELYSTPSSSVVKPGAWYHLVMMVNNTGTAQKLWVNGTLAVTWSYSLGSPCDDFEIGLGSLSYGPCIADYCDPKVYLTYPQYSTVTYTNSAAGSICTFSITWQSDIGLSKYLFSFSNGTSTFANSTWTAFSSNPQTITVTKKLNTTLGATIKWRWYANDTNNDFNSTNTQSFVTTMPLSCSISPSGSISIDAGQAKTFTATASGGTPPYTYHWYVNGAAKGNNSSSFLFSDSAGAYNIYVNVTDSATVPVTVKSNTVSVTVNSALAAPSVTASPATVDQGQTSVLSNSTVISSGTGPYTYQWFEKAPGGSYVAVGTSSTTYSFATTGATAVGSYNFVLQVTDNVGVAVNSTAATVTVNAALVAPIVMPSPSTVDQGQTSILTMSSVTTGTPSYLYEWFEMAPEESYVKAGSGSSFSFVTSDATATGSWSFILQVTDSTGAAVNSTAVSVVVNVALAAPTITASASTVDQGQTSVLSNSSVISTGTPSYAYQWFEMAPGASGYSAIGGATLTSYSFATSGTTALGIWHFELNVTDATGTVVASNVVWVTVNLVPSVSVSPSSATLDVGQFQVFTATASGGTGSLSYQWYLNGQNVGTGATYNFSAESAGSDSIQVTVTDSASTPYTATSNTASVTVNSAPTVSVTPTSWTMDIGQSETFTATASGGSGTYSSYEWYVDGQLQSSQASTFIYSPSVGSQGIHSITVTVTDSLGATSPQSSPAIVTVNPALAAPSLKASPGTVDQGQTSVLSNSTVISTGTGPYLYQWFEMAPGTSSYSAIGGATLTSYSFVTSVFTTTGVWHFELNVTDATGAVMTSNAVTVTVNLAPHVTVSPSSATLGVGQSQLFAANASGGTGSLSYEWYQNNTLFSGATSWNWTFTPTSTGVYLIYVAVTDSVSVKATSNTATVTVGIHEVAVTNVTLSKSVVIVGGSINVNITVENEGSYTETFNVTLIGSWDGYSWTIYTFTNVTLAPGSAVTLTITGLGFNQGSYTLSVQVYGAYVSDTYSGVTVLVAPIALFRPWSWHPPIPL